MVTLRLGVCCIFLLSFDGVRLGSCNTKDGLLFPLGDPMAEDASMEETPTNEDAEGYGDDLEEEQEGWSSIAEAFQQSNPVFENILYLQGDENSSNSYIIIGDYLTLVDPAIDYNAYKELFDLPQYGAADVGKIVLTHGHPKHAMGTMQLFRFPIIKDKRDLEVVLHEAGPPELIRILKSFGCTVTKVRGNTNLDLGGQDWEAIPTPNHARDCLCLYHAQTRTLISGDVVLPEPKVSLETRTAGNPGRCLSSLRSLSRRGIENLLPGHGPPIASTGGKVIDENYFAVIERLIGVKAGTRFCEVASTLAHQGLCEEALYCCDRHLALCPNDARLWKLKTLCLNDLGRFSEAVSAFARLAELASNEAGDAFTLMGKGYASIWLGDYEHSLRCFNTVLHRRPNRHVTLLCMAAVLYLSDRPEEPEEREQFRAEFMAGLRKQFFSKEKSPTKAAEPE
jgi:glyoxylase-like metal-dependent hydrolase (beta-lactamase superfamily II)